MRQRVATSKGVLQLWDAEAYAATKRVLLLRAGVEPHPGPLAPPAMLTAYSIAQKVQRRPDEERRLHEKV